MSEKIKGYSCIFCKNPLFFSNKGIYLKHLMDEHRKEIIDFILNKSISNIKQSHSKWIICNTNR